MSTDGNCTQTKRSSEALKGGKLLCNPVAAQVRLKYCMNLTSYFVTWLLKSVKAAGGTMQQTCLITLSYRCSFNSNFCSFDLDPSTASYFVFIIPTRHPINFTSNSVPMRVMAKCADTVQVVILGRVKALLWRTILQDIYSV